MTDLLDAPSETAPETPTTDAAVATALRDGLTLLRARLDAPDLADATTIHELRVALRRVRTVLAVVARAAPTDAVAALRAATGGLADVIGEARDWDVFVTETLARHAPDPGTDGHAALVAVAEALRQAAHRRLADYRAGRETANVLKTVRAFRRRPALARRQRRAVGGAVRRSGAAGARPAARPRAEARPWPRPARRGGAA